MLKSDIKNFVLANRMNGKRETFMLDDEGLEDYLSWAFGRNYLFHSLDENGLNAIGVAYPLPKPSDGTVLSVIPYDEYVPVSEELGKDICIMDWITLNKDSKLELAKRFFQRFPNWESGRICGIHYGKVKFFNKKYAEKLLTL